MRKTRYGFVIRLHPGTRDEYVRLHRQVWPEVLAIIARQNIRNYSIFLRTLPDGRDWLFSTYDYFGADFDADMAAIAADPTTQQWWKLTAPLQDPLPDRPLGTWWVPMDEVFRYDGPTGQESV